jgi:hypothetical protein
MCFEGGSAVGTENAQILEPMVVGHAVDVIEDQRHSPAAPDLFLAAFLAPPLLHPLAEEALFQLTARVSRALDHDALERPSAARGDSPTSRVRVEVGG